MKVSKGEVAADAAPPRLPQEPLEQAVIPQDRDGAVQSRPQLQVIIGEQPLRAPVGSDLREEILKEFLVELKMR